MKDIEIRRQWQRKGVGKKGETGQLWGKKKNGSGDIGQIYVDFNI